MEKLKALGSELLFKRFIAYIVVATFILSTFIAIAVSMATEAVQKEEERIYYENLDKSTRHIIKHYLNEYEYKLKRLIQTTNLVPLLEKGDREAMYALLKPKFDIFRREAPNFQVMHVHLANGNSFLRVHQPMFYGDDIASIRPMLQEIHKKHTFISGYETGVYANVYRIMGPIFNQEGKYIGALEIGLNPNFIVDKIEEINGYRGVYFVKEYMPHLYDDANNYVIGEYRLHAQKPEDVERVSQMLSSQTSLKNYEEVIYKNKRYVTHVLPLKDFNGENIIKLVFFQEIVKKNLFFTLYQIVLYVLIVLMLIFFILLIYKRIQTYQKLVSEIYLEKLEIIKKNETAIEKVSERLEMAVSGTKDGLWDWNLQTNEVYFSPRWKSMLGFTHEELLDSFETWEERVHPEDLQKTIDAIKKSQEKEGLIYNSVHRLRHKDGHWVWILDRGKTFFDSDGKPVRMVGFHTDISEYKELESKLKDAKNEFEMFMTHIPYLVRIVDENLELVYENRAATEFYVELEAWVKDEIMSLNKKAYNEGVAEEILEFIGLKEEIFRALFFRIMHDNGEISIGQVYINITKQKVLAKELQVKNDLMIAQSRYAEMGEMISMIAHQWRQPLSVITMNVNNVLVDIELDNFDINSLKESLVDINAQALHLSKTIDDFRNFFRPDKVKEIIGLEEVFWQAYGVIRKSLESHNIEIETDFRNVTKVQVFTRELQQVFINLLKNAKEAMESNKTQSKKITVKIFQDTGSVFLEMCDNGGGVPQGVIEKIFEPYFSTKDEKNGTGLGLYMSKMIVEKHLQGTLSVENSLEGSCFRIQLPGCEIENE
ncbi:MAG: PAS domain-containing protein [Campylobacterales bacterium]|nr:PAS domain-containing protein [Campylobacterales bacterium]